MIRILIVLAVAIGLSSTPVVARNAVGLGEATIREAGAAPIPVSIWYPAKTPGGTAVAGRRLPLIVISHGNGGSMQGHADTARALAAEGFVVAALEHPGDNYRDQSRATTLGERSAALSRTIDFMTGQWAGRAAIDPRRIGAFGFSSGGFTVLAAAGGQPDLALLGPHCAAKPDRSDCRLIAGHGTFATPTFVPDSRLRALVVAAPALGFTFAHGLANLTIPIQLWRADEDQVLPAPDYADAVRAALPRPPQFETVAGAGHFDFLAPCDADLARAAPDICASRAGFDRVAFHRRFNAAVVEFFQTSLAR